MPGAALRSSSGRGETSRTPVGPVTYVDASVLRTFEQDGEILTTGTVPVINALSDLRPCQARRSPHDREHLATSTDGSYLLGLENVALLVLAGTKAAWPSAARHRGFEPPQVVHRSERRCETVTPRADTRSRGAAIGAHVLSTDVWTSMGQDLEADERALVFPSYQLGQKLVDLADPDVIVLHCLPAHRGQEITDEVIDGPRSVVWDQAENRLHTQKALLPRLFGVA